MKRVGSMPAYLDLVGYVPLNSIMNFTMPQNKTHYHHSPSLDIDFLATVRKGIGDTVSKIPQRQLRIMWIQTTWTSILDSKPTIFLVLKLLNPEHDDESKFPFACTGPPNSAYGHWLPPHGANPEVIRLLALAERPELDWIYCTLDLPQAWERVCLRGWSYPLTSFALVQNTWSPLIADEPMYVFEGPQEQDYYRQAMIGVRTGAIDIQKIQFPVNKSSLIVPPNGTTAAKSLSPVPLVA